ncbi:hypothetical protein Hypma_014550 [Hypsizygus marmoreus]|uniref:Uncharacterized protein n=1 Tax=Hypsizygus marmoreus TaxID=39966 RepID=A0A369J9Y0_HYPMA|nr:hypothetical protein Hypma_014550 [Hypsizygus marmoreus]
MALKQTQVHPSSTLCPNSDLPFNGPHKPVHPIVKDACAIFSPPPQMNEFSKQVKERAKSAMKIAKEDGRRLEIIGLLDYWDYMQEHASH